MNSKKKLGLLKWPLYILFALLLFCIQYAPVKLGIFDGAILIIPFVVALSCFEEIISSVLTGVMFGFLLDYSSGQLFGFRALVFGIIALCVCLSIKLYVRPAFVSVMVCIAISTAAFIILEYFFFYVIKGYLSSFSVFTNIYIWSFFKTVIFGIPISYVTMQIYRLKPKKSSFDV